MNAPVQASAVRPDAQTRATENSDDPAVIERNIDRTRERLDRTLDALQTKLSPGQLVDRGLEFLKRNGGELAENFGQGVKQNPLPLLLTTVGVAWLISTSNHSPQVDAAQPHSRSARAGEAAGRAADTASDLAGRVAASTREAARGVGESATDVAHTISDSASFMADGLRSSAANAGASVRDAVSSAGQRVAAAAQATREQSGRALEGFQRLLQDQPLRVGLLAMAAGALVGSSLPPSDAEDRWMGAARDEGVAHAKQDARAAYERARSAARQTVQQEPRPGDSGDGELAPSAASTPAPAQTH